MSLLLVERNELPSCSLMNRGLYVAGVPGET